MESKIFHRAPKLADVVFEATQSPIAVEAQNTPNPAGHVIVVDVLRNLDLTKRAEQPLLVDEPIGNLRLDPIAVFREVVARRPMFLDPVLSSDYVVTRFAVRGQPVLTRCILRELFKRDGASAARAALHDSASLSLARFKYAIALRMVWGSSLN
jgi:hypothetical protein